MAKKIMETNLVELQEVEIPEAPKLEEIIPAPIEKKVRKKKTPTKKVDNIEVEKDISTMLETVFAFTALKAGEHWTITNEEANTISKPLTAMLEKYDLLEKVKTISDPAALIIAVSLIVIPRVMLGKQIENEKKKMLMEVKTNDGQSEIDSRQNIEPVKTKPTNRNPHTLKSVLGEIQEGTY